MEPDRAYWQRRAFAGWKETDLPDALRKVYATRLFGRRITSWSQLEGHADGHHRWKNAFPKEAERRGLRRRSWQ